MSAAPLPVFDLGTVPYGPVQSLQRALRRAVAEERGPGALLLLEHSPVITLGTRGGLDDLCAPARGFVPLPVVATERGGAATLHAPGQLICYPVVRIPGRDLRRYVFSLEEVLRRLLGSYGMAAERSRGRPGLYLGSRKIASLGLRTERWVSSHGTSLNVSVDLELFEYLVSCGEPRLRQTSLEAEIGRTAGMDEVKSRYLHHFEQVFGWELEPTEQPPLEEVPARLGLDQAGER